MVHTIHLICKDDQHLEHLPDGTFRTGVWYVSLEAATQAQRIALHRRRAEASFLQGRRVQSVADLVGGKRRFTFLVKADDAVVAWPADGGSGEKAYSGA